MTFLLFYVWFVSDAKGSERMLCRSAEKNLPEIVVHEVELKDEQVDLPKASIEICKDYAVWIYDICLLSTEPENRKADSVVMTRTANSPTTLILFWMPTSAVTSVQS